MGKGNVIKKKIAIFGTSKIADIVYSAIREDCQSRLEVVAFCVDDEYYNEETKFSLPIYKYSQMKNRLSPEEVQLLVAVGYHRMNRFRLDKMAQIKKDGYSLASYVSSLADISSSAVVGENSIIMNNSTIGPFCEIGDGVCIYNNATVSHHSTVGDGCWVTSGTTIGGNCIIGNRTFLGIGSIIGHNITVGANNFIGAGSIITKSTEDDSVYAVPDTPKYRLDTDRFMKLFKFD